jgi:predicted MFS family arabinose efflux permease
VLSTIQGIGGSTSLGAAGFIVAAFGYNAAFLTLTAVGVIALLVIVVAMPETRPTPGKLDQGTVRRKAGRSDRVRLGP